jgi:hypothetical protein
MELILIIVVLVLLFGGGGGYWDAGVAFGNTHTCGISREVEREAIWRR